MSNEIVPKGEPESIEVPVRPVFPRVSRIIEDAPPEQQVSFGQMWHILRKRKWFLVASIGACFGLALIFTLLSGRKYQSTSTVEFNKENSDALELNDARAGDANSMDYLVTQQTQVNALKGSDLALQVVKQLNLERRPEFKANQFLSDYVRTFPSEAGLPLEKAAHRRAEALQAFQKNLFVDIVPGTRMITVKFFSPDPQVAAAVVNTLVSDYQEQYMRIRMSATSQVSAFLSGQLDDLKNQVETSQERLVEFQKQAGIFGADESHNIVMTRLEAIDHQLTEAKASRIFAQAISQMARSGDPESLSGLVGIAAVNSASTMPSTLSLVETLRDQQAKLKAEYAEAAMKYGSAYPKLMQMQSEMKDLDESISTQRGVLAARAENDFLAAQQIEGGLRSAFEQAKEDANQMNDSSVQYSVLKHEVDSSRDLYDGLQKKLKEAGVLAGLRSTNFVVLDPGLSSDRPARPIVPVNLGIGLAGGMLIGVAGMFVLENVDETVSTPDDVEQVTMVPALGIVPRWKRPSRIKISTTAGMSIKETKILLISQPTSQAAEAYRAIRTSLMEMTRRGVSNVLLVTSALPEEGKTTTSLNCAAAFAQQGSRVLFVEADMRRPKVDGLLNLNRAVGLSSMISGEPCPGLPVRLPSMPKLAVIPAGPRSTYPAELLGTPRMAELVNQWRAEYDFVVIDTPPVLSVTDAVVLAPLCDAVVLVARSRVTKRQSLHRARSLFLRTRTRVAGVVVNGFDVDSPDYGAYYGFENNSKAGRGYFESSDNESTKGLLS
jgi:polysaccharide biosynthesis transport protein